jgi:hypothetical protein
VNIRPGWIDNIESWEEVKKEIYTVDGYNYEGELGLSIVSST